MRDDPQHPAAPAMRGDSAPAVPAKVSPTECGAGDVDFAYDTPAQPLRIGATNCPTLAA